MNPAAHAIDLLCKLTEEQQPKKHSDHVLELTRLGLFVRVVTLQLMQMGSNALYISEITAAQSPSEPGITITCVGAGESPEAATANATGQWSLGVLPVLVEWRGQHSCMTSTQEFVSAGGSFNLLAGPSILRGQPEPHSGGEGLSSLLNVVLEPLRSKRLVQNIHWLELFASKYVDGSTDATCRLNNRDWSAGQRALSQAASSWPSSGEPLQTSRQFVLLLPKQGERSKLVLPGFFTRLFGRG